MKKTSTNNRRKKLPLLLGALLIISVAAYGTRAYFSDSAKQQANIALSLGDVDISMANTSKWAYTPLNVNNSSEALNKNTSLLANGVKIPEAKLAAIDDASEITNVRPGDAFTRKFVVTNDGTLDVKLSLVNGSIQKNVEGTPFTLAIGQPENTILMPGDEASYTVTITVATNITNEYNTGNINYTEDPLVKIALGYIEESLIIEAVQLNGELGQN